MTMRLEKRWQVGDPGAVYEFDIKLPRITGVRDITNEEFEIEAEDSIQFFVEDLRERYSWIGQVYQTGRSGGWLAIEDKKGLATTAKLENISKMIDEAMKDFIKQLRSQYPA